MTEAPQDRKPRKFSLRNISLRKLNHKYDFLMSHDETGRAMFGFKLNLLNLILVIIGMALLLVIVTSVIIAFTPLREYIPGYTDVNLDRQVYELNLRADSLSRELTKRDIYFQNLKRVIEGYDFAADSAKVSVDIYEPLPVGVTDTITLRKSKQDSLLRAEYEAQNQYNLLDVEVTPLKVPQTVKNFFVPLTGVVINGFNPAEGHYGVDITSDGDQIINATFEGTVVFASWSIENGYCIGLQHTDGYFSAYKHNATLLKKEGDYVKAGEAIAIFGGSGQTDHEEHLHFELWHNSIPLNPADYMQLKVAHPNP